MAGGYRYTRQVVRHDAARWAEKRVVSSTRIYDTGLANRITLSDVHTNFNVAQLPQHLSIQLYSRCVGQDNVSNSGVSAAIYKSSSVHQRYICHLRSRMQ